MSKIHGGDIYNNKIEHDFSVNLNPLGCPKEVIDAISAATLRLHEYPDYEQKRVREKVATLCGVFSENVICGNGASELFMAIMRAMSPKCGLVISPSFYGYEYALGSHGCRIERHFLHEESGFLLEEDILQRLTKEVDVFFLCNPNNPTGRSIDASLLERIVKRCEECGIWLVLDECFAEMALNAVSYADKVNDYGKLIVVKAFTKLLAIPGVRFGYGLSRKENIELIRNNLPEWNLSVFAEEAAISGCRALKDGRFVEETRQIIEKEKSYLTSELTKAGITVFPSDVDFVLIKSDKALFESLLQKGILIRNCSNFRGLSEGFYRIAVKNHDENRSLIEKLSEVL